jgi:selenocysteine-specific elongation factor
MASMAHIIVGTAGHIDHGKTALVKALTGVDTDRLKEEKERGITTDLGFASLRLDDTLTIGFVDVPGHERFIKNMLAGVGGIDVVMLVIAADESVMPQTREHLAICELLHVRQGLTVLTKVDAVDREMADLVQLEVQEFLRGSFLEHAPIVRVSAHTGQGMAELIQALRTLAAAAAPRDSSSLFRLPIDRCFTMKGFGAVAAGTLLSGRIRRDDEVEILPAGKPARVRGVQVHGAAVEEARAGQRTALNLQRVELADLERGMVITVPGVFAPSTRFDVDFELLASATPFPPRKRIRFHVGTTELIGHLVLLGQDVLEPGKSALARVRLEKPAFALPGDRFVVRQYSPMVTLGGGQILDAQPPRLRRSDPRLPARLRVLKQGTMADRIRLFVQESGRAALGEAALVGRLGLAPTAIREQLRALAASGHVRIVGEQPLVTAAAEVFDQSVADATREIHQFHAAEPLLPGIGREDLRARVFAHASPVFFRAVLDHLAAKQIAAIDQDIVRAFGRSITLEASDERTREQLVASFREMGLQAPAPDGVAAAAGIDRGTARKIIQMLVKEQRLVRINDALVLDRAAVDRLIADVRARKASNPRFGVADFKELTGLSRKYAVPLLEYLDSQRITRRMGDERVIL